MRKLQVWHVNIVKTHLESFELAFWLSIIGDLAKGVRS